MLLRRIVSGMMLTLLLIVMSAWAFNIHPVETTSTTMIFLDDCPTTQESEKATNCGTATENTDWWLMYRHDPRHTGYSTSKAPNESQIVWTRQFGDWVRSSPAVHNNLVFIASDDTMIHALNATTGEEVWNYTTGGYMVSSPGVAHGRVYFGSDDRKFYCLSETTGEFLWSFTTGGKVSSSPCLTDDRVLFGSEDNKLYCFDAITGNHLWNFSTGEKVRSSPAVADGKVFFGSVDTRFYALDLISGAFVWSYATIGSITVSPSVLNGKVFTSSYNTIYCFDALDGDPIWNYTAGGAIHSSPAIAEGNIYVGCDDFKMYCLNMENGESKWNFTTWDTIYSSPAVADGKIFFGSNDRKVYCLNATTGTFIWSYNTEGYIRTSSPAVANGVVFIASSYGAFSGKLFAFGSLNTPPVAANLTITPLLPLTTDNLIGNYDYSDEDGNPEKGTEIRWYKDDILQSVYNDTLIIPFEATVKGQTWYFTVRPKDGIDFGGLQVSPPVTIQNSLPSIDSVMITPDPAYTNDGLIANPSGWIDVDGDSEGYLYQWQKYEAGSWWNINGATDQTLGHENFRKGDLIKIICVPYDGQGCGDAREDTIIISNGPPAINSYYPLTNPTIAEGESQEFNITKSDIDLDQLTVEWYINGTKMFEASDSYIYAANFESAGAYNVTVVVSDGDNQTKHEWLLIITDVERDVAVINIFLSKTVVGQSYSLEINVTVENQGVYHEVFNVTVYANTTMIKIKEIILANGTSTVITFLWNTTGFAKGNYTISAYVTALPGEIDTADNNSTDGWIVVAMVGDITGPEGYPDGKCDIRDIATVAMLYGIDYPDPRYNANCDLTGPTPGLADGKIDIWDIGILAKNFGEIDP